MVRSVPLKLPFPSTAFVPALGRGAQAGPLPRKHKLQLEPDTVAPSSTGVAGAVDPTLVRANITPGMCFVDRDTAEELVLKMTAKQKRRFKQRRNSDGKFYLCCAEPSSGRKGEGCSFTFMMHLSKKLARLAEEDPRRAPHGTWKVSCGKVQDCLRCSALSSANSP